MKKMCKWGCKDPFRVTVVGFLLLFYSGCKEKEPVEPDLVSCADGVFVINEGNYNGGNASLDFLGRDGVYHSNVFFNATERALGDVAQSVTLVGDKAYVVVNNSGKVEVLKLPLLEEVCTISGLRSPRHLLPLGDGRAYVSDLYSKSIHVVNLNTCAKIGEIPTGGWTEDMAFVAGKAWVAQAGTDKVLVINPVTNVILDSLTVGREPMALQIDVQGNLWVLCSGSLGPEHGALARIDPGTMTVEASWTFPNVTSFPSELVSNPRGDTLYWIDGDIYRMGIGDSVLPGQAWVNAGGQTFYALGMDILSGMLYVADGVDFVQRGWVMRYDRNGVQRGRWNAGIIPGGLGFVN